jgi:hypothetical protein
MGGTEKWWCIRYVSFIGAVPVLFAGFRKTSTYLYVENSGIIAQLLLIRRFNI